MTGLERVAWLYQARRVNQQTAGAGGALVTRISVPTGVVARLVHLDAIGPLTSTALTVDYQDEDGGGMGSACLASVAAGAQRSCSLPIAGPTSTSSGNLRNSVDMLIGPGRYLVIGGTAAADTETLTVGIVLLLSAPTAPTWDTTGSAGTPSLGASSISTANALQAVLMP